MLLSKEITNVLFHFILKGSYDAFLKIIILRFWCNRICWHALMFKKHILFQILYIIVGPLCPASLKRLVYYQGRINHCARRGWSPGARARRGPVIGCGDWLVIGSADRQSPPHPHLLALLFSGSFPYISFTFEFVFPIKCIYLIFCFWTTCVSIRRPLRPHSPLFASFWRNLEMVMHYSKKKNNVWEGLF